MSERSESPSTSDRVSYSSHTEHDDFFDVRPSCGPLRGCSLLHQLAVEHSSEQSLQQIQMSQVWAWLCSHTKTEMMTQLAFVECIGKGQFGEVHRAICTVDDPQHVAVKTLTEARLIMNTLLRLHHIATTVL